ncbi:MAG: PHP domain-containing protein [Myxococcales bacterium]|nr:PHP domain-containing protein [Myxococcales bacterium]
MGVHSIAAGGVEYPVTGGQPRRSGVRGAYHVHTSASHDGHASAEAVAAAARATGLQFVVLTDHNLEQIPEPAFVDGVLLIHGVELSTPSGHAVALGVPHGLTEEQRRGDAVGAVLAMGGQVYLAHPVHPHNPWRDPDAGARATGFELYSGDTMFRRAVTSPASLACALGAYFANPVHGMMVLSRPDPDAVAALLGPGIPRAGLCSHDAHGVPPHEAPFSAMAIYVPLSSLSKEPREAAREVLESLASGEALCAFDALGDPAGFELRGLGASRSAAVGQPLTVKLPPTGNAKTRVAVFGAARLLDEGLTILPERPGLALMEVQLLAPGCLWSEEWRPWIVPSPIVVR